MGRLRQGALGLRRTTTLARDRLKTLGSDNRLAYVGGEGVGNLGDDAMFLAARRLLPHTPLISLEALKREERLRILGLSGQRYFAGGVLGGGTLINPMWLETGRTLASWERPLWTLGTGVGSCGFAQGPQVELEPWRPLLERFRALGVRGPRSERTLRQLGLEAARVVGDPALALTRGEISVPDDPPTFALNAFLPKDQVPESPMLAALAQAAGSLVAKGWKPLPMAFHWSDRAALSRTLELMGQGDQEIRFITDPEEFLRQVAPCTLSVGIRLHGAVLSCCCGVPPLLIGYRDKCFDFMESMELDEWCISLLAPQDLEARLHRLARQAGGMRQGVLDKARHWKGELEAYGRKVASSLDRKEGI